MAKQLILCDCSGSQEIDSERLSDVTGLSCSKMHSALCTSQTDSAAAAIGAGDAVICCTQEQRLFEEIAGEIGAPSPAFLDLRDRAGWTADEGDLLPKMSALVAEAALDTSAAKTVDVVSEGLCLIVGSGDVALAAAKRLQDSLAVTVLLTGEDEPPMSRDFDVVRGQLRQASGALGQFQVTIDALQQLDTTGRSWSWTAPRDGGHSECDIILDLTGGTPLFPAHEKREGYLRADPKGVQAVADAVLEASQLVGTFEKPLYVRSEPLLCAHSRASQTGCTNCLDVCPTGAISPNGDHVSIDPMICAGCGACASLCPSGSITYDAPPTDTLMRRIQVLAKAYLDAGGSAPRLLVVNEHGAEMIRLAARFGRGLPADVLPLELEAMNTFGHAEILAALAAGFAHVSLLMSPKVDRAVQERELTLAQAIAGDKATLLDLNDPDALSDALFGAEVPAPINEPLRPMGTRRQITRQAARALAPEADMLPLPDDAPYGAVLVDTDSCTLCLSCVSLCPSGALGDNPDLPQLRFQEDACLQCGLCANVCPEQAISYEPRLNLQPEALSQVVVHEEEPFACVECGTLFGVKSTIERITEKLAGKHAMFATSDAARMIQMCDDCRVNAQFHQENNPFEGKERPRVRTTADYLSKRRDH
ncbi:MULTISPECIES: 4Fe-4S binding protein [Rhodobacterales]|jgi:ferredoxin|uniref:4Fe-4S binding protein n=1 Tax=Rhodobacterales TaxID=204455 RepID=UPI00237FADB5|nr:4Fe-4S binding protein [Phaeobacter gallaeciensis]MDE4140418.1 4Fe-4S binding protein [Phaeobacter gallaeciensis]MDE4148889.1 4Fe-4S binding protein [Phaeobacter gallaeciensis]MDE4153111.1 4Fe-4S binding protein [Phaeobacter gallaeciensis]MDE4228475.1 4Fe-4S binding protein [Phaeobacter gallaeciensis]MDE4257551.1 4Fe-4S binding protein [Phaeobacter gallaeciensis]